MVKFIWRTYHPMHKSHLYGEQIMLNDLLQDKVEFTDSTEGLDGAVIAIRACDNMRYVNKLNEEISKLKWCVIIVTGNENVSNFHTAIKHPNCKVWLQTPEIEDQADRFLGFGYPTEDIKDFDRGVIRSRPYLVSFAGQVNHIRRRQAVENVRIMKNHFIFETPGFNQGMAYNDYREMLLSSKIVACPGGPETPDTFRVYEALEAGCIPIVDLVSARNAENYTGNYWEKVFEFCPLPVIYHWETLPIVVEEIMQNYLKVRDEVQEWWVHAKLDIPLSLIEHVEEIS